MENDKDGIMKLLRGKLFWRKWHLTTQQMTAARENTQEMA